MTSKRAPSAPAGTGLNGKKLWVAVVGDFDLDEHETALLREAVRAIDLLDELAAAIKKDGAMVAGKLHPAVVEARQGRIVLARMLAALRLPDGTAGDETQGRRQRRTGVRGAYRGQP